MVPLLLVLLLAVILFGAGFAVKILWWVALAVWWCGCSASSCAPPASAVAAAAGIDGDLNFARTPRRARPSWANSRGRCNT